MYPKVVYQPDKSKVSSELYGNGSRINYTYNPYGQVYTKTSVGLGTVTSKHDALGNLIFERDEPGGIKTYYQYDSEGRLYGEKVVTSTVANTSENFLYSSMNAFDEDGNVTKNSVTAGDRTATTSYSYTESGLPEHAALTSSRKVNFAYNEEDVLTGRTLTTNTPVEESFAYNDEGLISTHTVKHGEKADKYSYTYDDNGNITEIKKGDAVQQSYVYDENNQLIRENNVDINKTIVYDYDDGGNIETKTEYAFTLGELGAVVDTVNYSYDTEWKDKLTSYDGKSISYDAIGNPINYMGAQMTWFARQMMSYETDDLDITYKYDSDGLRTQKVVNGVKHEYYYVDGLLLFERNGDEYEIYYRYDSNGRPALAIKRDIAAEKNYYYYLITNTRGDVIETRNGDGNVNAKYTYDSWGKLISVTDANGNALPETSFAHQISLRYRGYVYDRETGLYYLQSRYYDPETGRFLNADGVDYIGYSGEVLSYNVFAYCENEPVNNWDPWGFEKDNITKFAADLAMVYGSYSVRRNRDGSKYYVSLGSSKVGISKWVNFFYGERKKFYKQMGIKYSTTTNYYTLNKNTQQAKKTITKWILAIIGGYFTRNTHWFIGATGGKIVGDLADNIIDGLIKKPGKYKTKTVTAIIPYSYTKYTGLHDEVCTIETYFLKKGKWVLERRFTTFFIDMSE